MGQTFVKIQKTLRRFMPESIDTIFVKRVYYNKNYVSIDLKA